MDLSVIPFLIMCFGLDVLIIIAIVTTRSKIRSDREWKHVRWLKILGLRETCLLTYRIYLSCGIEE